MTAEALWGNAIKSKSFKSVKNETIFIFWYGLLSTMHKSHLKCKNNQCVIKKNEIIIILRNLSLRLHWNNPNVCQYAILDPQLWAVRSRLTDQITCIQVYFLRLATCALLHRKIKGLTLILNKIVISIESVLIIIRYCVAPVTQNVPRYFVVKACHLSLSLQYVLRATTQYVFSEILTASLLEHSDQHTYARGIARSCRGSWGPMPLAGLIGIGVTVYFTQMEVWSNKSAMVFETSILDAEREGDNL